MKSERKLICIDYVCTDRHHDSVIMGNMRRLFLWLNSDKLE